MTNSLIICFVLIIFETVVVCSEYDNQEIIIDCLNITSGNKYTVYKDQPLKISIENCKVELLRCYNYFYASFQDPITFMLYSNNTVINTNVTDVMSTRWACLVLEEFHGERLYVYSNHNYTAREFFFNVHVKGAKFVNIVVNSVSLTLEQAHVSEKAHDGESYSFYKDGEMIDYVCRGRNISNSLQIKYYDKEGTLKFKSITKETLASLQFRSIMRYRNNEDYVICIFTSTLGEDYHYRTTFIRRNSNLDTNERDTEISINGLKLVPVLSRKAEDKIINIYQYKYIEGDVLNVTCEKLKQIIGDLKLYMSNSSIITRNKLKATDKSIMISLDTSHHLIDGKELHCDINNSIISEIQFLSDLPLKGVRLRGLPPENVIYQYNNDSNQWIMNYQYRTNEVLELTCVFKYKYADDIKEFQWKIGNDTSNTHPYINTDLSIQRTEVKKFFLQEMHNQSNIECHRVLLSEVVIKGGVILHLNLEPDANADSGEATDNGELFTILGASFGVIIFIVTTVCLACWWTKTKQVHLNQNAYENFYCETESPIPVFPSQWENCYQESHYTYIDENVFLNSPAYSGDPKYLYSRPNTRQSKTPNEHFYTDIYEYINAKNDSFRSGKNTLHAPNTSNYECINNDYNSGESLAGYDVLRRSDLIACDDKGNNRDKISQGCSKLNSITFSEDSNSERPERSSTNDYSNNLKTDNGVAFPEVNKGEVYVQPNEFAQKSSKDEKGFKPNNKNTNALHYSMDVNCENDCYG